MKIIGLTCHFSGNHDNSAALVVDGRVVFAESQERISRIKHDRHFPIAAIKHALQYEKVKISDIDYFASASPPTNFMKLFLNYIKGFQYAGFKKVLVWALARAFLLFKVSELPQFDKRPNTYLEMGLPKEKLLYVAHHLAHAETAYHFSGWRECLVVVLDGYGINDLGYPLCGSVYLGRDRQLEHLEDIPVYVSLGLYFGAVTVALGFKLNDGEGKTMGLAAFGKSSEAVKKMREVFPFFDGKKWVAKNNWLEINGVSRPEYFRLTPTYRYLRLLIEEYDAENIAFATQKIVEEELEKYIRYLFKKYSSKLNQREKKLAVAGGVFLNVKANTRLLQNKVVDDIFIYPCPADGGVAVGAAMAAYKKFGGVLDVIELEAVDLGCGFSKSEIKNAIRFFSRKIKVLDLGKTICKKVAEHLSKGEVVGWFQGRGEWGPRALGHRSVLADPRYIETKQRLNLRLKERDWFMPFAPVILEEYSKDFLQHGFGNPFMTLTDDVNSKKADNIPAAIHIDNTARSQIVKKKIDPLYWQLIDQFRQITGVPVLLNTSFNKHGLPIVHSPEDAIKHLLWGCIDELVIGNFLITRK